MSAINSHQQNQHVTGEWSSSHRLSAAENEDELLQRMEQIMLELTRIIESVEDQNNTRQENLSNPLGGNSHSLSNTIPLYPLKGNLLEESDNIFQEAEEGEGGRRPHALKDLFSNGQLDE